MMPIVEDLTPSEVSTWNIHRALQFIIAIASLTPILAKIPQKITPQTLTSNNQTLATSDNDLLWKTDFYDQTADCGSVN